MEIADSIGDPALLLLTLGVLIDLDGTDALAARAGVTSGRIRQSLPDDSMRAHFDASEVVQRAGRRR